MIKRIWDKAGGTIMKILMFFVLWVFASSFLVGCGEKTKQNAPDKLTIQTKNKDEGIVKVESEAEGEVFSYKGKMTIEKDPMSTVVTVIIPNDESILEENK